MSCMNWKGSLPPPACPCAFRPQATSFPSAVTTIMWLSPGWNSVQEAEGTKELTLGDGTNEDGGVCVLENQARSLNLPQEMDTAFRPMSCVMGGLL